MGLAAPALADDPHIAFVFSPFPDGTVPPSYGSAAIANAPDGATWFGTARLPTHGEELRTSLARVAPDGSRRSVALNPHSMDAARDGSVCFVDMNLTRGIARRFDTTMHLTSYAPPFLSRPPALAVDAKAAWFAGHSDDALVFGPTFGSITAGGTVREYRIEAVK